MKENIIAGFVPFGEVNTPKEIIDKKSRRALQEIKSLGFNLRAADPVTDDPEGKDVKRAIQQLGSGNLDLLIICIAGWIPSHTVISITCKFKHTPMILWGLSGYLADGRLVTTADQAGTTALRKIFEDLNYRFIYLYNIVGKPSPLESIECFALASWTCSVLSECKVGMMGYRDMNLYNTLYEGISLKSGLGIEVEFFEMLEMVQRSENIPPKEVGQIHQKILYEWEFEGQPDDETLQKGIRYYLAIKKLARDRSYQAISLKDVDGMKKLLGFPPAMIFMLLADEDGLCVIPENDVMGAVTQLIVKNLTGQSAAYLEFYEFFRESILLGVPDFVPAGVVEGKVRVKPAAFGDLSGGILNISTMKTGRLTLARLSNTADRYSMHILTGEGKLRSWEEAGWDHPAPQLPGLEIFLDRPVEEFAQKVSGQHYIIAYGNQRDRLEDFCRLKNIIIA
jgi:hypothetical protein